MEDLISEIREHFATQVQGFRRIERMPQNYEAYTFRNGAEYGVAIKLEANFQIYEESSQITLKSLVFNNEDYLVLSACVQEFRNEFARFAYNFIEPGEDGSNRKLVVSSPYDWWEGWVEMLGNRFSDKKVYDVLAEMLALKDLYLIDNTIQWTVSGSGTHDIESDTGSFEVKSTLKKSESKVTISSQFQLDSVKPLKLCFYRMEESIQGLSINDLKEELVNYGYNPALLETQLEQRGYVSGNRTRDKKYVVLERRIYNVDSTFPRIVESSFKNDVYPRNIVKILYTIDLEGLYYQSEF
jgi:hypothetical protein